MPTSLPSQGDSFQCGIKWCTVRSVTFRSCSDEKKPTGTRLASGKSRLAGGAWSAVYCSSEVTSCDMLALCLSMAVPACICICLAVMLAVSVA